MMLYNNQGLSWGWSKDEIQAGEHVLVLKHEWGGYRIIESPCRNCEVAKVVKVFKQHDRIEKVNIDLQPDPMLLTYNTLICKVLIK